MLLGLKKRDRFKNCLFRCTINTEVTIHDPRKNYCLIDISDIEELINFIELIRVFLFTYIYTQMHLVNVFILIFIFYYRVLLFFQTKSERTSFKYVHLQIKNIFTFSF